MTLVVFDKAAMWFAKNAFTAKGVVTTNMTVGTLALPDFSNSDLTVHRLVAVWRSDETLIAAISASHSLRSSSVGRELWPNLVGKDSL